jgi:hypothetical protein
MRELHQASLVYSIALGLAILGIMSPIAFSISIGMFSEVYLHIGTILFDFKLGSGFNFHEPIIILQYFLLIILRPVFAYSFIRYYNGQTTAEQVILSGFIGEAPHLFTYLLMAPSGFLSIFVTPLPLHIFVGMSIILMNPFGLPLTPWEDFPEASDYS